MMSGMNVRAFSIKMRDGSVALMQVIQQPDGSWPSVEECLAKWTPEQRAEVESHRPISFDNLPTNRAFRNAWRDTGTKIETDMPAAREIWRGTLRRLREPLLAQLDVAYQRADERSDAAAKQSIAAQKQALRDVTADPAIEAASTPEELMAVIPAALNGGK